MGTRRLASDASTAVRLAKGYRSGSRVRYERDESGLLWSLKWIACVSTWLRRFAASRPFLFTLPSSHSFLSPIRSSLLNLEKSRLAAPPDYFYFSLFNTLRYWRMLDDEATAHIKFVDHKDMDWPHYDDFMDEPSYLDSLSIKQYESMGARDAACINSVRQEAFIARLSMLRDEPRAFDLQGT